MARIVCVDGRSFSAYETEYARWRTRVRSALHPRRMLAHKGAVGQAMADDER